MYLDKEQLKFLKSLNTKEAWNEDISYGQLEMIEFLDKHELIKVKRKVIHTRIDKETHTYSNTYGDILSVSLSEQGKAFLAEIKYERRNKWIPYIITTTVSTLALMKSYGFGIDDLFILCKNIIGLLRK